MVVLATLPAVPFGVTAALDLDMAVNRAPGLRTGGGWQDATAVSSSIASEFVKMARKQQEATSPVSEAIPAPSTSTAPWGYADNISVAHATTWQDADRRGTTSASPFGDMNHGRRSALAALFQDAARKPATARDEWKILSPENRPGLVIPFEPAAAFDLATGSSFDKAVRDFHDRRVLWEDGIPPQAGKSPVPPGGGVTPEEPPCYTTPEGDKVVLLFKDSAVLNANLLFKCGRVAPVEPTATIVVPVKRAYIVINQVNLRRVSDNTEIPCKSINLSLDTDSWTWGFNASVHYTALSLVEPQNFGEPVELVVTINGANYRVLVESISRDRTFGSTSISVSGRGKSAVLADPYSPIFTFTNTGVRTAQQLMNDALMDNGVSIGWEVDFGLDDWSVPAGVFSHTGSYMSAVKAIAEAAGGYIMPDPVLNRLYVKPRYQVAPWNFHTLTADYSLPSAVTARESIVWTDKANYDSVYVSGTSTGVTALVKKTGTSATYPAQMVVDPLITDDIAARQRGTAILGNTGRIANVTLSLPVLAETGIIVPGKIIDYVDGGVTRRGITRGVTVSTAMPSIRQTIEVETHVY